MENTTSYTNAAILYMSKYNNIQEITSPSSSTQYTVSDVGTARSKPYYVYTYKMSLIAVLTGRLSIIDFLRENEIVKTFIECEQLAYYINKDRRVGGLKGFYITTHLVKLDDATRQKYMKELLIKNAL